MPDEPKNRTQPAATSDADEELLERIRQDFAYVRAYWHDHHEQMEKDMRCMACEPPPEFKKDREGKPCIWPDEVSQYIKQCNNSLRQNKRSIKISPKSMGATDRDAEHRQAYMRGIEDASRAQSIYLRGFESCVECGMGAWRVTLLKTGPEEMEPRIKPVPNQFSVYFDPDAQQPDFSDGNICFVLGPPMRERTFQAKYKNAKVRSFSGDVVAKAPDWFQNQEVLTAEYWTREEQEAEDGEKTYKVMQYVTNGVEILERHEWIGSWIPIIGMFGEELYLKEGGKIKRVFLSLVRRARDAQQMLAYIASKEAEEYNMVTASPYIAIKGQLDGEIWKTAHLKNRGFLEYQIPEGWQPQWGPPPPPTRPQFTPNIQSYQMSYESYRRKVQANMGISPLPTSAQRQNEKSGIALERIQTQEAIGSFHFVDNFVRALSNTGQQIDELITKLAERQALPKQLLGKDQKGEDRTLHVIGEGQVPPEESEHLPEADQFFAHRGKFEITISDGPNFQSQREEASAFVDVLLQSLPALGLPAPLMQQVVAIAIKLKNIGTYGDEIADLLSPPDPNDLDPKARAILAQSQGKIQLLTQEIQQLQLEKLGKVTETQGKLALADKEAATRMAEADKEQETKVLVAEISTKAQSLSERMTAFEDMMKQWHGQAHELAMMMQEHSHAKELADIQHQQALEQGEQGNQAALEQQQQQAALQPPQTARQ